MHSFSESTAVCMYVMLFTFSFRNSRQSDTDHGETDTRSIRTVPIGRLKGWIGRSDKQKIVAGNHQGPQSSVVDHKCRLHPTNTVSSFCFSGTPRPKRPYVLARFVCLSVGLVHFGRIVIARYPYHGLKLKSLIILIHRCQKALIDTCDFIGEQLLCR